MDFSFEKFCIVVLGFVQRYQTMQIINLWKVFFNAMLVKSQNSYSYPSSVCSCVNFVGFSHSIFLFSVPMVLVSARSQKTEIINTDNSGLTCKDLEEYPLQIFGAVGFNMGSLPIICGGYDGSTYSNQCHRMESGKWKPFANLAQGYVLY